MFTPNWYYYDITWFPVNSSENCGNFVLNVAVTGYMDHALLCAVPHAALPSPAAAPENPGNYPARIGRGTRW